MTGFAGWTTARGYNSCALLDFEFSISIRITRGDVRETNAIARRGLRGRHVCGGRTGTAEVGRGGKDDMVFLHREMGAPGRVPGPLSAQSLPAAEGAARRGGS